MKPETDIANALRATRTRLGLSQQQLAEAAGVTRQAIGGVEAGRYAPTAAVALRLARALGCTVEELFWLEEDLPAVQAVPVGGVDLPRDARVTLARVGGRWVAHALHGERAFRRELIPADGLVAEGGAPERVRVKLLDEPESLARTVLVAGCTPALSLWARSAERWHPGLRVHWVHANSTEGLRMLARGEVHAAGVHLYHAATGEFNAPFVREALRGRPAALVHLGVWEEGLAVAPGNPKGLQGPKDLGAPSVCIVNREPGAGARVLLDAALSEAGVEGSSVRGYGDLRHSHEEIAAAVMAGGPDAGVTTAAVARTFGLEFLPLRLVRYDLALPAEFLGEEPVRQLLGTLQHRWVRKQLQVLGGYDTTETGEITRVEG
jgi:molybdate-binding protein/DNA-binding XRE family transcriptional regulator